MKQLSPEKRFWERVATHLRERRQMSAALATALVTEHVERIQRRDDWELVYHWEPQDIADDVLRSSRFAADHPVPGGHARFLTTLVEVLHYVSDSGATLPMVRVWISQKYDLQGSRALAGYADAIGRLGVWKKENGGLILTGIGEQLLRADGENAQQLVLDLKRRTIRGYNNLLVALADGSKSLEELHEILRNELKLDWKTLNQTRFRIDWLRSLGCVSTKTTASGENLYELTQVGRAAAGTIKDRCQAISV